MIRKMIIGFSIILLTAGSLSACGKKRPPVPPSQSDTQSEATTTQ